MNYLYTPEEAIQLRQRYVNDYAIPAVALCFSQYPQLQSATMLIGQYCCDEAIDAVHCHFIFSVLETPDLAAAFEVEEGLDPVNLPELPAHYDIIDCIWENGQWQEGEYLEWDSNANAIPAFAGFCREDCDQQMTLADVYIPYAILRRDGDEIAVEVVGHLLRPWLDGIEPMAWDGEKWDDIEMDQRAYA